MQDYIDNKKEIQNAFLDYIDCEYQNELKYSKLKDLLEHNQLFNSREEALLFLHMILGVANNHHRTNFFFVKIETILLSYKNEVNHFFTNNELFQLFKVNKPILLFLLKENIIALNEEIINDLKKDQDHQYFYPEIEQFYKESFAKEEEDRKTFTVDNYGSIVSSIDEFERKREKGENDSYICELIRNDSIREFVFHVNQANVNLSGKINPSIFETNPFLQANPPELIEYAAFFGSVKIYKYLRSKEVKMNPSLYAYAVHSRNAKMIHLLENDELISTQGAYEAALNESFKCFHAEISEYIINNLIDQKERESFSYLSLYYNFDIMLDDVNRFLCFCYFCAINYVQMVKYLLSIEGFDIDLNKEIIRQSII